MNIKPFPQRLVYLVALAILLVVSFLVGSQATSDQPANAQPASVQPASALADPDAPEATRLCTISNIGVYENRMHVYCPTSSTVDYFAAPLTSAAESRQANRYLAILNAAYALDKQVRVQFTTLISANPPGCNLDDCRKLTGVTLSK